MHFASESAAARDSEDAAGRHKSTFAPSIDGGRVMLRQWMAADFDFYADYLGTAATAQYFGGVCDRQKTWRHLASLIGHWALRGFGVYVVDDLAVGSPIGCAGLWEPHGWPCRELVFWFTADAYLSGSARLAVQLAMAQAQAAFPREPMTSFIHPQNAASLTLARGLGGTLHGIEPLFDFGPHVRVSYPP